MLHVELDQSRGFEDYCAATFAIKIRRSLLRPEICPHQQRFNSREGIKHNNDIIGATNKGHIEKDREKSAQGLDGGSQSINLVCVFPTFI
jgi:hypothetical protein